MKHFLFRVFMNIHKDRQGYRFHGADPDHDTPAQIINEFLGVDAMEIVCKHDKQTLFMPIEFAAAWEDKIVNRPDLWLYDDIPPDYHCLLLERMA